MKTKIFKPKVPIRMNNLNWPQAKARFPHLKPSGDVDKDGVKNKFDCKPFDRKRQGFFHKDQGVSDEVSVDFEDIKKLKTIGDVQMLERDTLRRDK